MSFPHTLVRLNPYEGLCLTADDLLTEQLYHRRTLHRHSLFLHGYGIVQGLQVELEQRKRRYTAVIKSGYGITRAGQGVHLMSDVVVPLEVPKQDGEYVLWLFHVERADPDSSRPVYDTDEQHEARIQEQCAPRLEEKGCHLRIVIKHLFEVRYDPRFVDGVAMKPTTDMVIESS